MTNEHSLENTLRLVALAQDDDQDALHVLFARYTPRVRRIVRMRLGSSSWHAFDADDVVQDALIDAFRGLKDFDVGSEGRFCNWLAKLVENRIRMTIRRESAAQRGGGRAKALADTDQSRLGALLLGSEPTPTQHARGREMDDRIEAALSTMSKRYREVLIHRTFCQMSYADIADEMELASESVARSLHSKALRELSNRVG